MADEAFDAPDYFEIKVTDIKVLRTTWSLKSVYMGPLVGDDEDVGKWGIMEDDRVATNEPGSRDHVNYSWKIYPDETTAREVWNTDYTRGRSRKY